MAAGFWMCGLAAGCVVQRSRLCFAGAIRDAFLWRMPSRARAVLMLLGAALVGVAAVQYLLGVPGNVLPVGWHTVVGGLVFGLGMGLAGACALTTLVRLGEGAVAYALAVASLVLGGNLRTTQREGENRSNTRAGFAKKWKSTQSMSKPLSIKGSRTVR
ncbi:MAG: YeeE/YedE thiosulfate transporter family protein [Bacillota bacterium]|nr:YeeE/YedE thiosulfate transporter family protein [Bacillota bacterium]